MSVPIAGSIVPRHKPLNLHSGCSKRTQERKFFQVECRTLGKLVSVLWFVITLNSGQEVPDSRKSFGRSLKHLVVCVLYFTDNCDQLTVHLMWEEITVT